MTGGMQEGWTPASSGWYLRPGTNELVYHDGLAWTGKVRPAPVLRGHRPLRVLGAATSWGVGLVTALFVLLAFLALWQYRTLGRLGELAGADLAEAAESYDRVAGVVLVVVFSALGALVVVAIVFVAWFHRAYKNLRPLGLGGRYYGSGWAIGAWFVPILNLFRPKQIMDDIVRGSAYARDGGYGREWEKRSVPVGLHVWWGVLLLVQVIGSFAEGGEEVAGSLEEFVSAARAGTGFLVLWGTLFVVAGVLLVRAVRRVTSSQEHGVSLRRAAGLLER